METLRTVSNCTLYCLKYTPSIEFSFIPWLYSSLLNDRKIYGVEYGNRACNRVQTACVALPIIFRMVVSLPVLQSIIDLLVVLFFAASTFRWISKKFSEWLKVFVCYRQFFLIVNAADIIFKNVLLLVNV